MIIWTERSKLELKFIFDIISLDSKINAKYIVNGIKQRASYIKFFNSIGRRVPEFNNFKIREVFFQKFRIIYTVKNSNIFILSVRSMRSKI